MNRAYLHLAALTLPLLGLGGMWLSADRLSSQGTEWDVPIQGYDPRDLLQGHYVQFQYDWPGLNNTDPAMRGLNLCIEGQAPVITKAVRSDAPNLTREGKPCPNYVSGFAPGAGWSGGTIGGRLYASQGEALRLQEQLRDRTRQGLIRIRLRPDGHITPLRITFRPRPPQASATPAP